MLHQILLLVLFVLLALFVLFELLLTLEALTTSHTLNNLLRNGTGIGRDHLRPLQIEDVLGDRWELRHSPLGVVDVELRGQVQLVVHDLVEADVARRTND